MSVTGIEFSFKNFAVPPVESISILNLIRFFANISILLLSVTEISALFILTLPLKTLLKSEVVILKYIPN